MSSSKRSITPPGSPGVVLRVEPPSGGVLVGLTIAVWILALGIYRFLLQ